MPLVRVIGSKRGVGRGVPDRGSRELRAIVDVPAKVFCASTGRGVRGDLEKLKFYKGETLGNRGTLRVITSPAKGKRTPRQAALLRA